MVDAIHVLLGSIEQIRSKKPREATNCRKDSLRVSGRVVRWMDDIYNLNVFVLEPIPEGGWSKRRFPKVPARTMRKLRESFGALGLSTTPPRTSLSLPPPTEERFGFTDSLPSHGHHEGKVERLRLRSDSE